MELVIVGTRKSFSFLLVVAQYFVFSQWLLCMSMVDGIPFFTIDEGNEIYIIKKSISLGSNIV
jgi:hypothetical protein